MPLGLRTNWGPFFYEHCLASDLRPSLIAPYNCWAGVQREGWSILRVLSWQMVRAAKPHPCAAPNNHRSASEPHAVGRT